MGLTAFFAGVPVADFDAARQWYERLMGAPPDFLPKEDEAVWQVDGAGWIYVVADPERAGRALLTLMVDDLEAQVAELAGRGLATGEIDTMPGLAKKAVITDPEGNRITFGEALS